MKKILIVAAAAGLMTLAACTPAAENNTVAEKTAEANVEAYQEDANLTVENAGAPVENVAEGNAM